MAYVPAPSPTVVDQTTLMKKYLQFVAALTDANTRKLNFKLSWYNGRISNVCFLKKVFLSNVFVYLR